MKPTFRASELDRILSCNGSITLVPLVAPREGNEGHEGSMLHWMIASRAISELGASPPEGGLLPPDVPDGYELPANALWIVEWAIRHIRETVPADWSLMVEVPLAYEFGRWVSSGHIDLLAISPCVTKSIKIDWKTGRDPVDPADNNWQIFDYDCLTKIAWPTITHSTSQIAQPMLVEEDDFERVSTSIMEGDRLERAVETLDAAVCKAMDNRMELNSSRKACNWCPVGCQCFALQEEIRLMKIQMTEEMLATIGKQPNDELLGNWVVSARTLTRPIKDAEELLHARLDESGVVQAGNGTTITRKVGKGGYEITHPIPFYKAARDMLGTDERMAAVYKPSLTRLTDEVAELMNIPKSGKSAITASGIVDAQFKPFTKQQERRMLVFG